jgi:hypothetical protein
MLFIDDVHMKNDFEGDAQIIPIHLDTINFKEEVSDKVMAVVCLVNKNNLVTKDQELFTFSPEYIILESDMEEYLLRVREILYTLPRRKRARTREGVGTFCSNFKIFDKDDSPTCL